MIAVLAVIVGSALLFLVWRGSRGQQVSIRFATRGAGVVLSGALVLGGLFIVTDPGENLVIEDAGFEGSMGVGRRVEGIVENRTDRVMAQVRVELDFIDRNSQIIGTSVVETSGIEGEGRWEFVVPVPSDSVVGFRGRVGSPDNVRPMWLGGGCGSSLCRSE